MAFLRNILVPVDFSEPSVRAVEFAVQMAETTGGNVTLISVCDDPILNAPTTGKEFRDNAEAQARVRMDELVGQFPEDNRPNVVVVSGIASKEILNYSVQNDTELIVVGTVGRSAIRDVLIGSVSLNVIKQAHCPVVSIR